MYIAVTPEKLDDLSSRLKRMSGSLQDIERRLQRALNRLDWETRQKPGIQGNWHRAQKLAQSNIGEAESMASFLVRQANAFREADRQGVNSLANLGGRFANFIEKIMNSPFGALICFPFKLVNGLMNLGGYMTGSPKTNTAPFSLPKVGSDIAVTLSTALPIAAAVLGTSGILQLILGPRYTVISNIIENMRKGFQAFWGGAKGTDAATSQKSTTKIGAGKAEETKKEQVKGSIKDVPGLKGTYKIIPKAYESYINSLKEKHSNWDFYFYDVAAPKGGNKTFNSFVENQFRYNTSNDPAYLWRDANGKPSAVIDGKDYRRVSEEAIRKLSDPRYYLDEKLIWAFKMDGFDPELQTLEGVKKILSNPGDGTTNHLRQYAENFYNAAKDGNVDAYTLVSKANNETGHGNQELAKGYVLKANTPYTVQINGKTVTRYTPNNDMTVYNFGSIGCTDGKGNIFRGAIYALDPNRDGNLNDAWTSVDKAIKGMVDFQKNGYISKGQDTLYTMKFNVVDGNYNHQYQTNILAPSTSECTSIRNRLSGIKDEKIIFKIPVFSDFK